MENFGMRKLLTVATFVLLLAISSAKAQSVVSGWQGTVTLSAGVYTPITAANTVMAQGSIALPSTFGTLTVGNASASGTLYVCWYTSAATSINGCEPLLPGAADSPLLSATNQATPPTLYMSGGGTAFVRGGN